MANDDRNLESFLQRATRSEVERIGDQQWLTVYSSHHTDEGNGGRFCALVPEDRLGEVLGHASWDLSVDGGMPGFSQGPGKNGRRVTTYHRFGSDDGVEPLVFLRSFHGVKPGCFELAEEFRHFHNLYHDRHNEKYVRIDDAGEEEVVAEVVNGEVRVRTRRLRQFLAARRMHLAIFFDLVVYSRLALDDVPPEERAVEYTTSAVRYSFHVADDIGTRGRTFSRLLGKTAIAPLPVEQSGVWPYEAKREEFADFIVGVDKDGNNVFASCNPDGLNNYFGKNKGAPHFLTPVVFRREVLKKYYDNEKYAVEDGYLHCGSLWGLRMDNHGEDVTVFLGDLGESLTSQEQLYWKSFNKTPQGGGKDLSETAFKRGFLAEFTDPSAPDLRFKSKLTHFIEEWEKKFGWHLFRPVREDDGHVFKRLRAPLTESKGEFEDMLGCLAKLLIEGLNDSELVKQLGSSVPDERSIAKFERYLTAKGYPHVRRDIELLKLLYDVRSKAVAHRKGDNYKKLAQAIGLPNRSARDVFSEWLVQATEMLDSLGEFFLSAAVTSSPTSK